MPVRLEHPVGLPTPDPAADSDDWAALVDSQLKTVRQSAGNWRTGLAALLALITGILAIREPGTMGGLAPWAADTVGGILLASLALAAVGAWFALSAAYGSPAVIDHDAFRKAGGLTGVRFGLARAAVHQLRWARWATVAALALMAAAVAVTWYAPRAPSALIEVERVADPAVCGTLIASRSGHLDIRPEGGAAVRVPARSLVSLRLVNDCP
jgi:hypothetical protein